MLYSSELWPLYVRLGEAVRTCGIFTALVTMVCGIEGTSIISIVVGKLHARTDLI